MKIIRLLSAAIVLVLGLAACGSATGSSPASPVQGAGNTSQASFQGYLGTGQGFVEFLSLHAQADGSLTGDMLIDSSTSTGNTSPAWQMSSQDYPASMTENGGQVTLTWAASSAPPTAAPWTARR